MSKYDRLTDREKEAVHYARNFHAWRKKFSGTLVDFMRQKPKGIKSDVWRSWYFFPCGNTRMCVSAQIVRRLLREKRI